MAARTPCLHRCSTIRATSPNHEGVEGTDWEEVWIITDPSAIVFMCASLMESVLFFLITEAHFYPGSLPVTSRCASRGLFRLTKTKVARSRACREHDASFSHAQHAERLRYKI